MPQERRRQLIDGLSPNAIAALPYLFEIWAARGHQTPPEGDWTTWLILGGRGAGKTRAGAEWIRTQVEGSKPSDPGRVKRIALIAQTLDEARDVMVMGESGILACSPADRRPEWIDGRKMLRWRNGAEAVCYSAANPEKLRGPQFDCAWSDELGKWRKARKTWDMLQLALRLGERPRQVVTTTPRANKVLEELIEDKSTVVTSAPTWANAANLAESFIREVETRYGGTSFGRQELEGEMALDRPGALWSRAMIEGARVKRAPELDRIVVAVDPPATSGDDADECGLVVAGLGADGLAYVLADRSAQGLTPARWAERAVALYHEYEADRIVAEVNQGGEMVGDLVRRADPTVSYRAVRASRGKGARAEPVSAAYERGAVRHAGHFPELEDQMCAFGAEDQRGSPDRVDALVWAITELLLAPSKPARVRIVGRR